MQIKIASWNVNSIRVRSKHVIDWILKENPDVLMLQELKCEKHQMPDFELSSYNIAASYQKTYNGVAIFSKYPIDEIRDSFDGDPDPSQARYIEIACNTPIGYSRFISLYVPNGGEVGSDKFEYKLDFYDAITKHVQRLRKNDELLFIGGDYNVAPKEIDVYDPAGLKNSTCFTMSEREKLYKFQNKTKLFDVYNLMHPDSAEFTWWDYRGNSFNQDKGMRIDHILVNPRAVDMLKDCYIDRQERAKEQASDHAPIVAVMTLHPISKEV